MPSSPLPRPGILARAVVGEKCTFWIDNLRYTNYKVHVQHVNGNEEPESLINGDVTFLQVISIENNSSK